MQHVTNPLRFLLVIVRKIFLLSFTLCNIYITFRYAPQQTRFLSITETNNYAVYANNLSLFSVTSEFLMSNQVLQLSRWPLEHEH